MTPDIAGTCWNCEIVPIKVLDDMLLLTVPDVKDALLWAADAEQFHPAFKTDVINMSFRTSGADEVYDANMCLKLAQPDLHEGILEAFRAGIVLVSAAGDATTPLSEQSFYCLARINHPDGVGSWGGSHGGDTNGFERAVVIGGQDCSGGTSLP